MWFFFFHGDLCIISEGHSNGKILIKKLAKVGLGLLAYNSCENLSSISLSHHKVYFKTKELLVDISV